MEEQTGEKKKVLIIEDEEDLRSALEEMLEQNGFEALVAEDGMKGLHMALEHKPDAILLDIILPSMHGTVFLERLRGYDWGKQIKVVVLSNRDDEVNRNRAERYGAFAYLVKSKTPLSDVVNMLHRALGAS